MNILGVLELGGESPLQQDEYNIAGQPADVHLENAPTNDVFAGNTPLKTRQPRR